VRTVELHEMRIESIRYLNMDFWKEHKKAELREAVA